MRIRLFVNFHASTFRLHTGLSAKLEFSAQTTNKVHLNNFVLWSHIGFKLDLETHKRHMDLSCKYELYICLNTKVSTAKDHGKNYSKA